jgi:hypothetical protein
MRGRQRAVGEVMGQGLAGYHAAEERIKAEERLEELFRRVAALQAKIDSIKTQLRLRGILYGK